MVYIYTAVAFQGTIPGILCQEYIKGDYKDITKQYGVEVGVYRADFNNGVYCKLEVRQ